VSASGSGSSSWTPPPEARPGSGRRRLLGCGLLLVIVVVAIGLLSWRTFGNGFAVVAASRGQIDSFRAFSNGPTLTVTFQAARGIDAPDGPRLACEVVRPALVGTDWALARWTIVNRAGDVIASDETSCD
jgi:hypothetical protein